MVLLTLLTMVISAWFAVSSRPFATAWDGLGEPQGGANGAARYGSYTASGVEAQGGTSVVKDSADQLLIVLMLRMLLMRKLMVKLICFDA